MVRWRDVGDIRVQRSANCEKKGRGRKVEVPGKARETLGSHSGMARTTK